MREREISGAHHGQSEGTHGFAGEPTRNTSSPGEGPRRRKGVVALVGSTAGAQGSAQVVVDNVNRAKKALNKAGLSYTEGTLEQVELENTPGALAEFAGTLAKKGINIDSAYVTAPKGAEKVVLLLATSSLATRL